MKPTVFEAQYRYIHVYVIYPQLGMYIIYRDSSPNAHNGTWKKPRYVKSRYARLLLYSKWSEKTPKPCSNEESILDEVTTV